MNDVIKSGPQIGNRKLGAFYAILGFCVIYTMVRALMPVWVDGIAPLDDIPENVKYLATFDVVSFFAANMLGKFAPSVVAGNPS